MQAVKNGVIMKSGVQNNIFPRTAVIGADGYIGRHLYNAYKSLDSDCLGTFTPGTQEYPQVDLRRPDLLSFHLSALGYKYVVVAAADTGLSRCEKDKVNTQKCNVEGSIELIRQLASDGITPIYFSSDNVFDGAEGFYAEDSPLNPLNEYGAQKGAMEQAIRDICGENYLILRLGKVFGMEKGDGTLLDEMASRLSQGMEVKAACDQIMTPLFIGDLVKAVMELQKEDAKGIFHLCCPEIWSRYELALVMAEALDADRSLVKRISLDDLSESFKRPKRTSLLTDRLHSTISMKFASIVDCIKQVANNYKKENE